MIIGGLQKTTLIDYPGKIAATIFLAGCSFRCPWCYSAELVLPEKIEKQPRISEEELFSFLKERKGLLDGLVICGGEPTINADLPQFINKIKDLGYLVKLDTNGSNPEMLENLIQGKLVDYVAMDVKLPKGRYPEIHSGSIENIQKSIDVLKQGRVDFEFRTTIVPSIHSKQDLIEMAKWIGGSNVLYYLQNFRPEKTIDPAFEDKKSYPKEYLEEIRKEIRGYFKTCEIR